MDTLFFWYLHKKFERVIVFFVNKYRLWPEKGVNSVSEVLIEATNMKKVFSGVVAIEGIDF